MAASEKAIRVIGKLRALRLTKAAGLAEAAVEETLTYYAFHEEHWRRFRNDPTLLFITPSSAPNHPRYLRAAPNNLRVVTNVDHNVHTIHDPKRITIVHHSPPTQLCGVKTPFTTDQQMRGAITA